MLLSDIIYCAFNLSNFNKQVFFSNYVVGDFNSRFVDVILPQSSWTITASIESRERAPCTAEFSVFLLILLKLHERFVFFFFLNFKPQ